MIKKLGLEMPTSTRTHADTNADPRSSHADKVNADRGLEKGEK